MSTPTQFFIIDEIQSEEYPGVRLATIAEPQVSAPIIPVILRSAYDALEAKINRMKEIVGEEDIQCGDCLEAKAEGYTICGECSVE